MSSLGQLRDMVQNNKSDIHHVELQLSRMQNDEESVTAVVGLIQGWVNPFADIQDLISISTAEATPKDIASDLLKACDIREQCYSNFKDKRIEKTHQQRHVMIQ